MENKDKKILANEKASKDVSSENSLSNDNENTKKPIRKVIKKDSSSKKKTKVRIVDSSDSATLSEESCLTSKKCKLNPNKQKKVKKLGVKNIVFDKKTIAKIEDICDKYVKNTRINTILAQINESAKSNDDYKIEDFVEDVDIIKCNNEELIFVKDIFVLFIDCIRYKKISYFNTLCYGLLRSGSIKQVKKFESIFNKRICFNNGSNTKGILLLCVLEMLCEYLLNNKKNIFEKIFNELNVNINDLLNYRVSYCNKTLKEYLNEIYTEIDYYLENKFDTKNGLLINYILDNLNKYNDGNFKDFLNINNKNIDELKMTYFSATKELKKDTQSKTIKIKENTEKKVRKCHKENVVKIVKKINTPVFNNANTKQMHNTNIYYPNSNYQPYKCFNKSVPQIVNTQNSNYIMPNQINVPMQYNYSQNLHLPNISNQGFNKAVPQIVNTQQKSNYITPSQINAPMQYNYSQNLHLPNISNQGFSFNKTVPQVMNTQQYNNCIVPNQVRIPVVQYGYYQVPINTFDYDYCNNAYNNVMFQPNFVNLPTKHLNIQNNLNNTLANINNRNVFNIQLNGSNINRNLVVQMLNNIRPVNNNQFINIDNPPQNFCNLNCFLRFNYNDDNNNDYCCINKHNIMLTTSNQNNMNNDGVYILHNDNHFTAVRRITHNGQVYFFGIDSMNNQNFMDDFLNIYPNSIIVNLKLDTVQQNINMNRDVADYNACAIWAYTNAIALSQMDLNNVIQNGIQYINLPNIDINELIKINFQVNEDNNINRQNDVNNVPVLMEDENNREQVIDVDMIMDNEGSNDINTYEKANEEFDEIFGIDHSKSRD